MAHLRYGGPPYRGKPGKLAKWLGLSTGAMTNRLDNMERRKLLRRVDDPDDRRGVIVELTDEGKQLWDARSAPRPRRSRSSPRLSTSASGASSTTSSGA